MLWLSDDGMAILWDHEAEPILGASPPRQVTDALQILEQRDHAGPDDEYLPVAGLDLTLAADRRKELPARGAVPRSLHVVRQPPERGARPTEQS
jgi:hypothetical protein